ncbi:MAG: copper resistance protein B [Candidatus Competibacteraceae bacterium]|nr:copper resistance protein B [Candidatus Competibacteraceae bacterium]
MTNHQSSHRLRAVLLASVLASTLLTTSAGAAEGGIYTFIQAEEFGYRLGDEDSFNWDAQGWIGGDYHKLWFKTEGERVNGEGFEEAEAQVLYSRLISQFWDLQAGLRYDFEPQPERSFAVFGLHGLAPYWFEINAKAFINDQGDLSARLEAEYELLLTQKLVLSPTLELNLAGGTDKERGVGSGFNDLELSLTLRYEVIREFAPYIGVVWEKQYGKTADLARAEGMDIERTAFMAGFRFWF